MIDRREFLCISGLAGLAVACGDAVTSAPSDISAARGGKGKQKTGNLRVATESFGNELNGPYLVTVDDTDTRPIGINDDELYAGLAVGAHTVLLHELSDPCAVIAGANPRSVTIEHKQTTETVFRVQCGTTDPIPPPPSSS